MSKTVIKVENISKRYRIGLKEELSDTFFGSLSSWIKYPFVNFRRVQELSKFNGEKESENIIWALKDVSFEVERGEVLGIIGPNGSGKSTLLKILSRITDPTSGRAVINGRVASLLEVGTGFHAELTGRENIYLNGTILGMKKREIDKKLDEIVDFSGVGKFIDTPVKRYSSGMRVRLAFSVAAHLEPEILLIDEVLAVGDIDFQNKCLKKIDSMSSSEGRTVLLVSHNMNSIQNICETAVLLNNGLISKPDKVDKIIELYYESMGSIGDATIQLNSSNNDKPMSIQKIQISNHENEPSVRIDRGYPFTIKIDYFVNEHINNMAVIFTLNTLRNVGVCQSFNIDYEKDNKGSYSPGYYSSQVIIPGGILNIGDYQFYITLGSSKILHDYSKNLMFTITESDIVPSPCRSKNYHLFCLEPPLIWKTEKIKKE